jgi:hypothetical protein
MTWYATGRIASNWRSVRDLRWWIVAAIFRLLAPGNAFIEEARINVQVAQNAQCVPVAKIADGPLLL